MQLARVDPLVRHVRLLDLRSMGRALSELGAQLTSAWQLWGRTSPGPMTTHAP